MEINVGISECAKKVDNDCSRSFGSHVRCAGREAFDSVEPLLSAAFVYVVESNIFLAENLIMNCNF